MNDSDRLALAAAFQQDLFQGSVDDAARLLAEDATIENFFPHQGKKKPFVRALQHALSAMRDIQYTVRQTQMENDRVRLSFHVAGVHAKPLDFSFMKVPVVPPSHKHIAWPVLQWEYTITDNQISRIRNVGSLSTGMPGILKAFGVKLPARQGVRGLLSRFSPKPRKSPASAKPRKRLLRFLPLIPISVIAFTVLFMSSPINASAWKPEPVPAWTGALAPNAELGRAERLGLDQLAHPEDMAFDRHGRIYTGSDDGNIYRITLDHDGAVAALDTFAAVGGYPLGLAFDNAGHLIAAVKDVGLLSLDSTGKATLLTDTVEHTPITYANALAITADGTVYFSDSSVKYDRGWPYDVLEARPNGRLLAYFPDTHTTTVVKDNLYFPNGLVLAPSGDFLLVNESTRFRIARYWLKGPQQGTWEYFAENLPLLPDNISVDEAGNYLVGGTPRIGMIDSLQAHPVLKNQIAKIPVGVLRTIPTLKQNRYGLVVILSSTGSIKHSLHDPSGNIWAVSSARSQNGYIYIGTLFGRDIVRYRYQP